MGWTRTVETAQLPAVRRRSSPARDCDRSLGQVGDDRLELGIGLGLQRDAHAVLELLGGDPALGGGAVQTIDDLIAIGIRRAYRTVPAHTAQASAGTGRWQSLVTARPDLR